MIEVALDTTLGCEQARLSPDSQRIGGETARGDRRYPGLFEIEAGKLDLEEGDFSLRRAWRKHMKPFAVRANRRPGSPLARPSPGGRSGLRRSRSPAPDHRGWLGTPSNSPAPAEVTLSVQKESQDGEHMLVRFHRQRYRDRHSTGKAAKIFLLLHPADNSTRASMAEKRAWGLTISHRLTEMLVAASGWKSGAWRGRLVSFHGAPRPWPRKHGP